MDHGFKMGRGRWTEGMMDGKMKRKNVEGKGTLRYVRINKEVVNIYKIRLEKRWRLLKNNYQHWKLMLVFFTALFCIFHFFEAS